VVGIVGPRQVGKTTLAKLLSKQIKKETVLLDLENPRDLSKSTDPLLYFENNTTKCIIIDEVQTPLSWICNPAQPNQFIKLLSVFPLQ
jgi:predicted AAA+ superfamily ATPase